MTEQRTGEGRLLRQATEVMDRALQTGPKSSANVEVRASADGSIMGMARWTRDDGWAFEADVLRNLKTRGGGYVRLSVTRSW